MNEPATRVRLERKASDFARRSGAYLPQVGCATCCCCCCLHWIGAAVGGIVGMSQGWKWRPKEADRSPRLGSVVTNAYALAFVYATIGLVAFGVMASFNGESFFTTRMFIIPLVFLPFLFFLPVGAIALAHAAWSLRRKPPVAPPVEPLFPEEPLPATDVNAFDVVARMAWRAFWFAVLGTVVGYAIMWVWAMML